MLQSNRPPGRRTRKSSRTASWFWTICIRTPVQRTLSNSPFLNGSLRASTSSVASSALGIGRAQAADHFRREVHTRPLDIGGVPQALGISSHSHSRLQGHGRDRRALGARRPAAGPVQICIGDRDFRTRAIPAKTPESIRSGIGPWRAIVSGGKQKCSVVRRIVCSEISAIYFRSLSDEGLAVPAH